MSSLDWTIFNGLAGSVNLNFELLCRGIVRAHYGGAGTFRALANQPGVEFHLKLDRDCDLGVSGSWYGWQCKWYDIPGGTNIGAARRSQIKEALRKTEANLPGLTDWVLWTRQILTKADQNWFFSLRTKMRLHSWSGLEIENYLSGPAISLRETYFGELVLSPTVLKDMHTFSVAPIRRRWLPEAHQSLAAERAIRRILGDNAAWSEIAELATALSNDSSSIGLGISGIASELESGLANLVGHVENVGSSIKQLYELLSAGDFSHLLDSLPKITPVTMSERELLRTLRGKRLAISLDVSNALSDIARSRTLVHELEEALQPNLVAVVADAGFGKTQASAQLTAPTDNVPAGIFIQGKYLTSNGNLNDLAHRISVRGKLISSFESLLTAVDAAGKRNRCRIPIIIDGLNESEDPRNWKDLLISLLVLLPQYPNVQMICTVRSAFLNETIPEGAKILRMEGFEEDFSAAIRKYFKYYKIDAEDAELPLMLLNHPLSLRIFCEVTNPERKTFVGVESIPSSLSTLFERYISQVAERIAELSRKPFRIYIADVRDAIGKIGAYLWDNKIREIEIDSLRKMLGDEVRPWSESIVSALEHDGILIREPSTGSGHGRMSIVYDALAGYVIADALLTTRPIDQFDKWLADHKSQIVATTDLSRSGDVNQYQQPFAEDIFIALIGLVPLRIRGQQVWKLLSGLARERALYYTAHIDGELLDQDTVAELSRYVAEAGKFDTQRDVLRRLLAIRAAKNHPLNAEFLERVLLSMSMAERDLRWSEWVRKSPIVMNDLQRLSKRWSHGDYRERSDVLRARWIMWTLTSTNRYLRDQATHSLYCFGCLRASELFDLTLEAISTKDPYVIERMVAASYGTAMAVRTDLSRPDVRQVIIHFAKALCAKFFGPCSQYGTFHVLTLSYAIGVIEIALQMDPRQFSDEEISWFHPPIQNIRSPFKPSHEITDESIQDVEHAIGMDFGNYTIGRLLPNRRNYDFDNLDYKTVRRQIEQRMASLGYSSALFKEVDRQISNSQWREGRSPEAGRTDRYGKKYSWIAFFEMYGWLGSQRKLGEYRDNLRASDVDIDPSFPNSPKTFQPNLPEVFTKTSSDPLRWISKGPTPDYQNLLYSDSIDGEDGPWVLLEGYVQQNSSTDSREIFSFLRGIILNQKDVGDCLASFNQIDYPGNSAIPEPLEDYYTFAGEIPWSENFGRELRDSEGKISKDIRDAFNSHDGKQWLSGIDVEIPAFHFCWESYHSKLNVAGRTTVLAPALFEKLELNGRRGVWDYFDEEGKIASLYREAPEKENGDRVKLLFLRADLMSKYLGKKHQLVWLVWGERGSHYTQLETMRDSIQKAYSNHAHIHRYSRVWDEKAPPRNSRTTRTATNEQASKSSQNSGDRARKRAAKLKGAAKATKSPNEKQTKRKKTRTTKSARTRKNKK